MSKIQQNKKWISWNVFFKLDEFCTRTIGLPNCLEPMEKIEKRGENE